MNQQGIIKISRGGIRNRLDPNEDNSSEEVHNDFVELSKILKKVEEKYTNLDKSIPILKNNITLLENQLKETSKKLQDTELNKNRLLKENSKIPILNEKITNLESQLNESSRKLSENTTNYKNQLKLANAEKVKLNDSLNQKTAELDSKILDCAKLSEESSKIPILNKQITNLKAEISKLKKQFHRTSLENEELKEKYEKLTSENASLVLLKQTSLELENEISKCSHLSIENEELKKNFEKLTAENASLRVKQGDNDRTTLMLNQSVNTLEQKLKHLTLQLEKEIATSIKLNAENQKLKSLSSTTKSESQQLEENIKVEQLEEKLKQLSCELEKEVSKNIALGEYNKQLDRLISGFKSKTKSQNVTTTQSVENLRNSQEQLNDNSNFKVLIRDVPTDQILNPLEKTVIDLASKMSIVMNRNDITRVRIMERKGLSEYSNKVSLLVEFKTSEMKTTFLNNRSKLRLNSSTKTIQLKDFFENEIYSLFQYANEHLRPNGFQRIWCKDNQVFAKKSDSDAEIEIKSRNQVDVLAKPNWRS